MKYQIGIAVLCAAAAAPSFAESKEDERIKNSTTVLKEALERDLSPAVLGQAVCVAVYPSVKKVAIGIGGSYGRGVMVCRKGLEKTGQWTAPVMMSLDQGSLGLQLGGTATDFVLVVTKKEAAERALSGKTKLGSDAAVAAGPAGAQAGNYSPEADFLTYSRTSGAFAGVSLSGAGVEADKDANKNVYGKEMKPDQIIASAPIVPAAQPLVDLLNQTAPGRPRG